MPLPGLAPLIAHRPAGASGFVPIDVGGAHLWLRGDLGVSESSGVVSTWSDQSGNGNDASQSSTLNRPTVTASGINGLASLVFDKTLNRQFLTFADGVFSSLTEAELFVVAQDDTDDGSVLSEPCCFTDTTGANYVPFVDRKIYDNFGSDARHDTGFAPAAGAWAAPWLYNVSAIAGEWIARFNGAVVFTDAINTVGAFTYCNIGADPGDAVCMQGMITEVLVYDHKLSDADRSLVTGYLRTRYAI